MQLLAQLIQFKVMQGCLITISVHKADISFSTQIDLPACLKCLPSAHMHVVHATVNGCVNCALFNAVPNGYVYN